MSADNVDVVRRVYEAWRERGFGFVPGLMDPQIEYVNPPDAVEPGTRHGREGFAEAARNLLSIYVNYEVSAAEIHDLGQRVVVVARVATRSTGTDVPIEADRGYVFDLRAGLVTRFAWFNQPEDALAYAREPG
jgi:ketosteroid isomerase-like protein